MQINLLCHVYRPVASQAVYASCRFFRIRRMKSKANSVENSAKEYLDLKLEKAKIEKRIDELKMELEPFLEEQPEKTAEMCGWKFSLIESERESFKLSAAKEKIDGRTLKPFITLSKFNQIRTVFKGV